MAELGARDGEAPEGGHHVAHAQTGFFRNDARGQWRFYRLAQEMTPKTIDWDLFLGHQFELGGRKIGPTPKDQPFDRACSCVFLSRAVSWRCPMAG